MADETGEVKQEARVFQLTFSEDEAKLLAAETAAAVAIWLARGKEIPEVIAAAAADKTMRMMDAREATVESLSKKMTTLMEQL